MKDKEFIKPKQDFLFKQIFGKENSIHLLKYLINALLEISYEELENINILNSEFIRIREYDKTSQFDICARFGNTRDIDIEIQLYNKDDMKKRGLYYWKKMYGDNLKKGESYSKLYKCIVVIITDYEIEGIENTHSSFHIWEDRNHILYNDNLEIHIIQLPKLKNSDKLEYGKNFYDVMKFLNAKSVDEMHEIARNNKKVGELMERYEDIKEQKETWAMALAREKTIRDELIREREEQERKIRDARMNELSKVLKEKEKTLGEKEKHLEENEKKLEENKKELEEDKKELEEDKKELEEDRKKFEQEKKMLMDRAMIVAYLNIGLSDEEISEKMNVTIEEINNIKNR